MNRGEKLYLAIKREESVEAPASATVPAAVAETSGKMIQFEQMFVKNKDGVSSENGYIFSKKK